MSIICANWLTDTLVVEPPAAMILKSFFLTCCRGSTFLKVVVRHISIPWYKRATSIYIADTVVIILYKNAFLAGNASWSLIILPFSSAEREEHCFQ